MNLEQCVRRIDKYLLKDEQLSLVIDVQNYKDLSLLVQHYSVGDNSILNVENYCSFDGLPRLDDLFNDLLLKKDVCFVLGISSFLKLQGEQVLLKTIRSLLNMHVSGHIIIITYQCKRFLSIKDPRIMRRVIVVEGEEQVTPNFVFVSPKISSSIIPKAVKGINSFSSSVESEQTGTVYVFTEKTEYTFPHALFNITSLQDSYDVLSLKDVTTKQLSKEYGTDEQWNYALQVFENKETWVEVIDEELGSHVLLESVFSNYKNFSAYRQWLYFIALKLYGANNNLCLKDVSEKVTSIKDFVREIYRSILDKKDDAPDYWEFYRSRKAVLNQIGNPSAEVALFCNLVNGKGKKAIYYLTDNTQQEQEAIFTFLDQYGEEYDREELIRTLKIVYPNLYAYLQPYRFKNELLDKYFQDYKYQKVINRVFPEFLNTVLEQAVKRDYNLILDPRSTVIERINTENSQLYFMDAMGVEYLGYIVSICNALNLNMRITVCRCELPSITSRNKEFLDLWDKGNIVSIKDIDEVKHHGKYDYDYYSNSKLPLHLMKEMEIIRETLEKIRNTLVRGNIKSAVIISDHGASRLAVLYDTENIWEMQEKGIHSGRCCLKSEVDKQPDYATDAGDFWALANYDRFKGSRKANVEVHGGATLEEICVPIIELSYSDEIKEVYLMPVETDTVEYTDNLEIEVSYRKKAAIKLFVSSQDSEVCVCINDSYYEAAPLGHGFYRVDMPEIRKPGVYDVDVYSHDNLIAEKLKLTIKKESHKEKDLL